MRRGVRVVADAAEQDVDEAPATSAADAAVDGAGVAGVGQGIRDGRGRLRVGLGRRGIGERPPAHDVT